MTTYTLGFQDIDRSTWPVVGGKGANLAEMAGLGLPVFLQSGFNFRRGHDESTTLLLLSELADLRRDAG